MLSTIFNSLFGSSDALSDAQIERDKEVLLVQLKASVFPLQSNPSDLGLYSSVIREIDSLLANWQHGIELTWRCYVSGYSWHVSKANSLHGKVSVKADRIQ